jgi:hypothetical protein
MTMYVIACLSRHRQYLSSLCLFIRSSLLNLLVLDITVCAPLSQFRIHDHVLLLQFRSQHLLCRSGPSTFSSSTRPSSRRVCLSHSIRPAQRLPPRLLSRRCREKLAAASPGKVSCHVAHSATFSNSPVWRGLWLRRDLHELVCERPSKFWGR